MVLQFRIAGHFINLTSLYMRGGRKPRHPATLVRIQNASQQARSLQRGHTHTVKIFCLLRWERRRCPWAVVSMYVFRPPLRAVVPLARSVDVSSSLFVPLLPACTRIFLVKIGRRPFSTYEAHRRWFLAKTLLRPIT